MAAEVADWVARKTAQLVAAAGLTLGQARWVDQVTADYAASLPPGRYLALVEARIVEADPAAAEARAGHTRWRGSCAPGRPASTA